MDMKRLFLGALFFLLCRAPASAQAQGFSKIDAHAKIASFAAAIVDSPEPYAVIDGAGRIIGEITPHAVINLLSGKERSGAP